VYFGCPPADLIAAIMFRDRSGFTAVSWSPWNAQIGSDFNRGACNSSPPPQMGAIAANRDGNRWARSHVP
jgi:hypothetical protein